MSKSPILLGTPHAITLVVGNDPSRERRKAIGLRIYYAARHGMLTRYGGPKRGKGLWDLREVQNLIDEGFFSS